MQKRVAFSRVLNTERQRVDDSYFDSYSYFDIHREMLADKVRCGGQGSSWQMPPALLHESLKTKHHDIHSCVILRRSIAQRVQTPIYLPSTVCYSTQYARVP